MSTRSLGISVAPRLSVALTTLASHRSALSMKNVPAGGSTAPSTRSPTDSHYPHTVVPVDTPPHHLHWPSLRLHVRPFEELGIEVDVLVGCGVHAPATTPPVLEDLRRHATHAAGAAPTAKTAPPHRRRAPAPNTVADWWWTHRRDVRYGAVPSCSPRAPRRD